MKSWMSTRRPACAPPPKIWICGSGSSVAAGAAERLRTAACRATPRPRAPPPSKPRASHWRRGAPCSACRRARSGARSSAVWSSAAMPRERAGDLAVDIGDRALHVEAAERGAAVAQLDRLARALRRARRARSPGRTAPSSSAHSASTVGRPRRVPDAAGVHRADRASIAHRVELRAPGGARSHADGRPASREQAPRATRRTASRRASSVRYSTGDLPSTRASNRPGSSAAARSSSAAAGSQSTPAQVGVGAGRRSSEEGVGAGRRPQALQQQVVEAEGEVEGRIAPPGAFGVEKHRASGPDQDVLRADVAVHQRAVCVPSARPAPRARRASSGCLRPVASR